MLQYYFANYTINAIESLVCLIFIYFIVRLISKPLFDEVDEVEKKKVSLGMIVSVLISFGIGMALMMLIAFIGWFVLFFQWINNIYFNFALISTVGLFMYKLIMPKFSDLLQNSELRARFQKRYLIFIILCWVVVGLFLSFELLGIEIGALIPEDPNTPIFDYFLLGFQWAFFAVVIYAVLTKLILRVLPLDKRPPKEVSDKSILFGAFLSFGIWSIQLILVEVYLSRLFSITLYQQDIRILIIVVAITYLVGFFISMKKKYLPEALEEDRKLLEESMKDIEEGVSQIETEKEVLSVKNLVTYFYTEEGVVHAVEGVSFKIYEGEVLGLVGETGCGKSVTALSILQLIQTPGKILNGAVEFEGEDLLKKSKSEILSYRGDKITMIFQDPLNSLNPVFTVGKQISEVYLLHKKKELLEEASNSNHNSIYTVARQWSQQLLRDLNIPSPESVIDRYPHELSGGMRQRIQIAMGIACSPKLLIADEPTTALDVTVQNQILKLMKNLKTRFNTSILFITHDLAIISKMCNRVAVMYSGSIVEYGTTKAIFTKPYHPYTKGLLSAIPIEGREDEELAIIPGMVPNLIYPPSGCRFHPRCLYCFEPCDSKVPKSIEIEPRYFVSCHLYDREYRDLAKISIKKVEEPILNL
jgi:oligopeptide/dipeptide ABC transporter ATP-binding protein